MKNSHAGRVVTCDYYYYSEYFYWVLWDCYCLALV